MVGVLIVGFVANLLVRPVDPRFHMEPEGEEARGKPPSRARPPAAKPSEEGDPMSESQSRGSGRSGMVLVVVLWALVLIPLLWGVYQTLRASSPCSRR